MNGRESLRPKGSEGVFFLAFLIVTFSKGMESNGRVDDDRGDFVEKIEREFIRVGLVNAGEFRGLSGG